MDFNLPFELTEFLKNLDRFIDQEIKPLQARDDNERFFDHRREWARTDFDNGGLPRPEWEALLQQCYLRHSSARDVSYACLRDLGADVETTIGVAQAERAARAIAAGSVYVA